MASPLQDMYNFPTRLLTANSIYVAGDDVAVVAVVDELLEFFKRRSFQSFYIVHMDD